MKNLVVIAGPTAVGKTEVALNLAGILRTEVISADSRQVFKELNIGTAKPDPAQLVTIKHHLINSHSIQQQFDAAEFEKEGLKTLWGIFTDHNEAVLVGGSGLYIKGLCDGFDKIPKTDSSVRKQLISEWRSQGHQGLLEELRINDPKYYQSVDRNNPQRIIRAVEVIRSTGRPFSDFRSGSRSERDFGRIKIGLDMDRRELFDHIENRVDKMIKDGLFEEVRGLIKYRHLNALQTVGYKEVFDFFDGKYGESEAIAQIKKSTRRYAKRQLTWFKKDSEFKWFHPQDLSEIQKYLQNRLKS